MIKVKVNNSTVDIKDSKGNELTNVRLIQDENNPNVITTEDREHAAITNTLVEEMKNKK